MRSGINCKSKGAASHKLGSVGPLVDGKRKHFPRISKSTRLPARRCCKAFSRSTSFSRCRDCCPSQQQYLFSQLLPLLGSFCFVALSCDGQLCIPKVPAYIKTRVTRTHLARDSRSIMPCTGPGARNQRSFLALLALILETMR